MKMESIVLGVSESSVEEDLPDIQPNDDDDMFEGASISMLGR